MSLSLKVENLPKNSLAYTNAIYLTPQAVGALKNSRDGSAAPTPEATNSEAPLLLQVGYHVFLALPHKSVSDGCFALNGLQRRCASLTLNQTVTVSAFQPTAQEAAASLTLTVDLLTKAKPASPIEINTEELAERFKEVRLDEERSDSKSITPPSYITDNLLHVASLLTAARSSPHAHRRLTWTMYSPRARS